MDDFSVETPGLLTDPFLMVLHFHVTGEIFDLSESFLSSQRYRSHMGRYWDCKEDVQDLSLKFFKELKGLLGHICPSVALEHHYSIWELVPVFFLNGLFEPWQRVATCSIWKLLFVLIWKKSIMQYTAETTR